MIKKALIILFTFSLVVLAFGEGQGESQKQKIVFWTEKSFVEASNALYEKLAAEFGAENNAEVEIIFIPGTNLRTKIISGIAANATPDVLQIDIDIIAEAYQMGALADVSNLYTKLNKHSGGFFDGAFRAITYGGKQYGIPYGYNPTLYYERRDIAEQLGVSVKYWDDLVMVSEKLKGSGLNMSAYGVGVSRVPDSEDFFYPMLWSYGGGITQKDGTTLSFKSDATRKTISMYVDLYEKGALPRDTFSWDNASNNQAFQAGQIFSTQNADSIYRWLQDNNPDMLSATYIGAPPAGPQGRFMKGATWNQVIFENSQNKDLAKKWIEYLMKDDNYITMRRLWMLPVYKDLIKIQPWNEGALKAISDSLEYTQMIGYPGAPTLASGRTRNTYIMMETVLKVLVDNWSIDKAIDYGNDLLLKIYAE